MAELVVSFADRASVDIVQAGHPVRRFGHHPGQPATGLCHHLLGADPGPGVSRVL
jgi:hypothetical protein